MSKLFRATDQILQQLRPLLAHSDTAGMIEVPVCRTIDPENSWNSTIRAGLAPVVLTFLRDQGVEFKPVGNKIMVPREEIKRVIEVLEHPPQAEASSGLFTGLVSRLLRKSADNVR